MVNPAAPVQTGPGNEVHARNALQRLIAEHLDRTGETLADIARRGGLRRQTISALMHRPVFGAAPHVGTLDRLAVGLDVPASVVRQAAAESLMINPRQAVPRADQLAALAAELPPELLDVLIATARALRDADAERAGSVVNP